MKLINSIKNKINENEGVFMMFVRALIPRFFRSTGGLLGKNKYIKKKNIIKKTNQFCPLLNFI